MSFQRIHAQVSQLWNEMERKYSRSEEDWNDQVRRQFDAEYWRTLHGAQPDYLGSLDELAHVVQQARRHIH